MTPPIAWSLVLAAILLGTIIRFSGIESKSLWEDEIMSLAFATGHSYYPWYEDRQTVYNAEHYRAFLSLAPTYFSQRLVSLLRTETQAPFYFFLLNLWLHLFGTSEAALRSLSVIASLSSIPLVYALGCRLASTEVGIYSAFIFSVAPFQVAFAQYNRPYALLGFFALLSALAAVRLCRGEGSWSWLLVYAFAAILGMYTHYLFVWNLVFHWILVSFFQRNNRRFLLRWVFTQLCVGGALLLWAPIFLGQMRWNREAEGMTWIYWLSGAFSLPEIISYLGRNLALFISVGRIQGFCFSLTGGEACGVDAILTGLSYTIPILILGYCAWQFVVHLRLRLSKDARQPDAWGTCLLWGLCIFGGPLALDFVQGSHMSVLHRYFISASAPLYLAVAMAFASIANKRARTWVVSGFLVFLLVGSAFYLQGFSGTLIYEQGAREVARHLDGTANNNDLVLVLNPGPDPKDLAYYLKSNPAFGRVNIPQQWQFPLDIPAQLQKLTTGRKRVWYLDDRGPEKRAREVTLGWLRTYYKEIEFIEFKNLDLFFFSATAG